MNRVAQSREKNTPLLLSVTGKPGPQGSKKNLGNGVMIESSKDVKPWREAVKWAFQAKYARIPKPALPGAVSVCIVFTFWRPKSVTRKYHTVKPDIDKVTRSTFDALTQAGAWVDDSYVIEKHIYKRYVGEVGSMDVEGAQIAIRGIE